MGITILQNVVRQRQNFEVLTHRFSLKGVQNYGRTDVPELLKETFETMKNIHMIVDIPGIIYSN